MTDLYEIVGRTSIVRDNLMNRAGYVPYCGNANCSLGMPRTHFIRDQFECGCGWRSTFEADFITAYKAKWDTTPAGRAALKQTEAGHD